jgi:hypothetical protein
MQIVRMKRDTVRIFGGCAGGTALSFHYAWSLRQLPRFLVLPAQPPDILTVKVISFPDCSRKFVALRKCMCWKKFLNSVNTESRDNSVSTDLEIWVRFPAGVLIFSLATHPVCSGAYPVSYPIYRGVLSYGWKWSNCVADHYFQWRPTLRMHGALPPLPHTS